LQGQPPSNETPIQLWAERIRREQEQMRVFRRFRFQLTIAELDLALLPPILAFQTLTTNSNRDAENCEATIRNNSPEKTYSYMINNIEKDNQKRQPNMINGLGGLGVVLLIFNRLEEAEKVLLRILETTGALRPGPYEDLVTLVTMNNLAIVKLKQYKWREAEAILCQALQGEDTEVHKFDHLNSYPRNLYANLAWALYHQGKISESLDLQERVLESAELFDEPCAASYRYNYQYMKRASQN
jgi:tetratricopeptide (TPR) repeat protein